MTAMTMTSAATAPAMIGTLSVGGVFVEPESSRTRMQIPVRELQVTFDLQGHVSLQL